MKHFIIAAGVILGVALLAPGSAKAASNDTPAAAEIDCSVLSGSSYVCVRNNSTKTISGINCTGFWGSSPLSLPGGTIRPKAVAVVNFNMGKCNKTLTINFRAGNPVVFNGFDVNANTVLNISDD